MANTDYQGSIRGLGDNVIIRTRPTLSISDYTIGGGLTFEKPESPNVELPIDHAKAFAFEVNEVDEYQSDINLMDEFTDDATEQMQIVIDTDILGNIYGDVAPQNTGATAGAISGNIDLGSPGAPKALTEDNVVRFILQLGQALDEQNVPQTGRWLVIPAWMNTLVKDSFLRAANESGDGTSIARNGRVGMLDRFEVFNSNNLATVTDGTTSAQSTNIIAGHPASLTFASQMTRVEQKDNPNDFGWRICGLNVYGYKVIAPKYMAHGYVTAG